MEVRANYFIVGLFTLALLLGSLGFTLWIAKSDDETALAEYDVAFNESVTGLSVDNDVLFSGIRVGSVKKITLSETVPGAVRVRISLDPSTPVRMDSEARLSSRGLTGITVITISGGTPQSPIMRPKPGHAGFIRSVPSPLASVVQQVPDTIAQANVTLHRLELMLSDANIRSFNNSLASLERFSGALAANSGNISTILTNAAVTSAQLEKLAISANKVMTEDVRRTSEAMGQVATRLEKTMDVMEPGLRRFSREGLNDFNMLAVESRNLIHVMTRLCQKLESDPRRFLFGEPVQEYKN